MFFADGVGISGISVFEKRLGIAYIKPLKIGPEFGVGAL